MKEGIIRFFIQKKGRKFNLKKGELWTKGSTRAKGANKSLQKEGEWFKEEGKFEKRMKD